MKLSAARLRIHLTEVELVERQDSWPVVEAEKILRSGAFVGSVIEHHAVSNRTMLQARSFIAGLEKQGVSVPNGTTIIADRVTGSKGRFARRWHAPAGGLWGTLIYVNTLLPESRLLVPLAAGIACCETIRKYVGEAASIRWINDVLVDGGKTAGFLTETLTGDRSGEDYLLIGFGINVNNHHFPVELQQSATAVGLHCGRALDLESFCYDFLAKLGWNIGLLHYFEQVALHAQEDAEPFVHPLISRYRQLTDVVGRRVVFGFDVMSEPQFTAQVAGVAGDGGLQLLLEDGTEVREYSGEIRYIESPGLEPPA